MTINPVLSVSWINLLVNSAIQGSLIFIPLLGAQLGASDFQVGLIGAAYGGAYLVFSLYSGRQSDRRGRIVFIRAGLILCTITFAAQIFANSLCTLTIVRAAVGMALGITMSALVACASEFGAGLGRFSSMGSLGWIMGSLAAALLTAFSRLFAVSALCSLAAFALSLTIHPPEKNRPERKELPGMASVFRKGLPIYLAIFLRHLGAASVWIILPLYFTSIGINHTWIGLLYGLNFVVQSVVMRRLEHHNPVRVFALGQVLSIFVFIAYIFARHLWMVLIAQTMLGVAWACLYVGALVLVLRTGENKGTASGIFQSTLNLCGVIGPFLGGLIANNWGYQGVLVFAAALGVAGLTVAVPGTMSRRQST
ncbi:MAG: MFS transporter [Bacillota bacterium]